MKAILIIMILIFEGDAQPVVHNVEFDTMGSCKAAARVLEKEFTRKLETTPVGYQIRYIATFECVDG